MLVRDSYTCIYCKAQPGHMVKGKVLNKSDFTVDHIVPKSRGGKDQWGNTACACYVCNHRKGDKMPNEAGMRLAWEPKTPRTSYLVIAVGSGGAYASTVTFTVRDFVRPRESVTVAFTAMLPDEASAPVVPAPALMVCPSTSSFDDTIVEPW